MLSISDCACHRNSHVCRLLLCDRKMNFSVTFCRNSDFRSSVRTALPRLLDQRLLSKPPPPHARLRAHPRHPRRRARAHQNPAPPPFCRARSLPPFSSQSRSISPPRCLPPRVERAPGSDAPAQSAAPNRSRQRAPACATWQRSSGQGGGPSAQSQATGFHAVERLFGPFPDSTGALSQGRSPLCSFNR